MRLSNRDRVQCWLFAAGATLAFFVGVHVGEVRQTRYYEGLLRMLGITHGEVEVPKEYVHH